MSRINSKSEGAKLAWDLVSSLQKEFVSRLEKESKKLGEDITFQEVEWLRDHGIHGGGIRYETGMNQAFNRASVNISQVHYDDDSERNLASVTAISYTQFTSFPFSSFRRSGLVLLVRLGQTLQQGPQDCSQSWACTFFLPDVTWHHHT